MTFPRIARFRTASDLRSHCAAIGAQIPLDDTPLSVAEDSPLAHPVDIGGRRVGNRWCIHPMEGWDATIDGRPTDVLLRRWRRFGESGAKLVWGGEAVAVVEEGRANPHQLCAHACGRAGFVRLLEEVRSAHRGRHGDDADLLVALQLTHSGRFSKPTAGGRRPRIACHHPLLDARHGVDPGDAGAVVSDADVERLIDAFAAATRDAAAAGFDIDETNPLAIDLAEPIRLLEVLRDLGVAAVNLTAGSPYTVPHIQRPAAFPPSDGYPPPEDPLMGVWRQIDAASRAKAAVPDLVMVGSGYTYLQEFAVHAAQAVVRAGLVDVVGLGRMVLSYPEYPADALAGRPLARTLESCRGDGSDGTHNALRACLRMCL